MKLGVFDLEVRPVGPGKFETVLSYKQRTLFSWDNFETKEAAFSSAIQSCKKIFGVAFNGTCGPHFRAKTRIRNAVQWFPELKIEGIELIGNHYYYNEQYIRRGDWIVDSVVYTNKDFLEGFECIE